MNDLSSKQRLVKRFTSPERFAAMETESRAWIIEADCGLKISVWDAGGIRYKSLSTGKNRWGRCPHCGKRHWMTIQREMRP
jgi:hypothetical protein